MLTHETRALLARLALVKPFALQESMLPAAALLPAAQVAIDRFLIVGRRELKQLLHTYLRWLHQPDNDAATPEEAQRRFTILRLKFNIALTQFDTFADVITQRSESETGVWLGGLDVVGADALALPGYYDAPPSATSTGTLARRSGGRGRGCRADVENPVAIIRVPRERMVGSGIASSLVHEVGHQGRRCSISSIRLRPILQACSAAAARTGSPGRSGSAGSPKSSPTCGRSRGSASARRRA